MEETAPKKRRFLGKGYGPLAAILVTVSAIFASQVIVGLAFGFAVAVLGVDESWFDTSVLAQFLVILAAEAVLVWLLWIFMQRVKVKFSDIGLVKPQVRDVGYAIAGYAVYFVAFLIIVLIAQQVAPGLDLEQEQEIGFDKQTTGAALWLVFVSLVILPPIAEEITMRGFLYTGLRKKWTKFTAAIVTSLLFAAAHLQWGNGTPLLWVAALDTFTLSLILVHLREKTGSLSSPILVHMIKNGLAFAMLFIFKVT